MQYLCLQQKTNQENLHINHDGEISKLQNIILHILLSTKQYIGHIKAFQGQNVDFHSIFQAQKKHHIYFLKSPLRLNINAPAEIKGIQWQPSDIFCHNLIIL